MLSIIFSGSFSNGVTKCPRCGSNHLKYQMRSAGTKSATNYYHYHSATSWIIPAWHRKYKSKREYKSVALCQNCGYCFEPYSGNRVLNFLFWLLTLPIALGGLFFTSEWFKQNKKKFFIITGIVIAVVWILIIILYFMGMIIPDP